MSIIRTWILLRFVLVLVCGLLLRREGLLHLLADVAVILVGDLLLVLGEDAERDADERLLELHVQPVLAVLDAAGDLEIHPPETGAVVAHLELIPGHRAILDVAEEADAAGPRGHRREIVDR